MHYQLVKNLQWCMLKYVKTQQGKKLEVTFIIVKSLGNFLLSFCKCCKPRGSGEELREARGTTEGSLHHR